MTDFTDWTQCHPQAATDLLSLLAPARSMPFDGPLEVSKTEAWSQQRTRFKIARQGGRAFRNNVGSTSSKCPDCGTPHRPIRYGLANDSVQLNRKIKSSDLILAIPRLITSAMVGQTIAQFGAVECKRPNWHYTGSKGEAEQAAFLSLITSLGGYATFSTGEIIL